MTVTSKNSVNYQDVPCPFCSLLCDDLAIKNQNGRLTVTRNGCQLAKEKFEVNLPALKTTDQGQRLYA
jgi:Formylmethanofuran dehydrogenase subunit B